MIPDELRNNPKLMRLHRIIAGKARGWRDPTREQADSLVTWIGIAIAEWSLAERRRRKARKKRR